MSTSCIACGMPMTKDEDHAQGDPSLTYCHYCARSDGSMRSYEEVLVGMSGFLTKTQGLAESAAREVARSMMASLPAWRGK